MKILFAASEAYPLVKTGGLGDVIHALPRALQQQGQDVRVILPAYRLVLEQISEMRIAGWLRVQGASRIHDVRILETRDHHLGVPLLLVDAPDLFDRPGSPYLHPDGYNWHDNADRFTVFSRAVAQLAASNEILDWKPDVVHAHDWQTGLLPALLKLAPESPASVYTIHNLSYSGIFSHEEFSHLHLPAEWWSAEALEFFGNFSMLKGGIVFADRITTVSPTYAREIQTPGFGYGFDGVLRAHAHKLSGILNGIDLDIWNPATDHYLPEHYSVKHRYLAGKRANKQKLLEQLGVAVKEKDLEKPLLGFIGRLVEQKGVDLILQVIPHILDNHDARFVILGSGEQHFENALRELAALYPQRLLLTLGYSEELAHRIEAGSDIFLMPSRFEPCGLNQMYSLRYGTPPLVHHVGGLADTVTDATPENLEKGSATGFVFHEPSAAAMLATVERALELYRHPKPWHQLIRTAMSQDFGWTQSAAEYIRLYEDITA
jgi:starch synthase